MCADNTTDIGKRAEDEACVHLTAQGLRLLQRNYRCPRGEIDLIMREGDTLVFVEIRFRRDATFGSAAESVDARKRARLLAAALHYLQHHPAAAQAPVRFDVVALRPDGAQGQRFSLDWIADAFRP